MLEHGGYVGEVEQGCVGATSFGVVLEEGVAPVGEVVGDLGAQGEGVDGDGWSAAGLAGGCSAGGGGGELEPEPGAADGLEVASDLGGVLRGGGLVAGGGGGRLGHAVSLVGEMRSRRLLGDDGADEGLLRLVEVEAVEDAADDGGDKIALAFGEPGRGARRRRP